MQVLVGHEDPLGLADLSEAADREDNVVWEVAISAGGESSEDNFYFEAEARAWLDRFPNITGA